MTLAEALGAEIRAEAAAQHVTISELSRAAGVNRASLYTWIDAKVAFPVHGVETIAGVLGMPPHVLLLRAEERAWNTPKF